MFGPSGGGKTSLLKVIKNFYEGWTGHITYNGQPISKFDSNIGYLLQDSVFFQSKSILANLQVTGASKEEVGVLLDQMDLGHILEKDVRSLSGGQRQRLSIVRCLLMRPQVLLMDEPTSALDPKNATLCLNMVSDYIHKNKGIGIIISHNIYNMHIYNKIMYLREGKMEYFGEDKDYLVNG